MDSEVEIILTATAALWLVAVMVLFCVAIYKMCHFDKDGLGRPRKRALGWLSNVASQIATLGALIFVVAYLFERLAAKNGLIYTGVFFSFWILVMLFAPNIRRWRSNG